MSGAIDEAVRQIMASRYQPRVGDRVRVTGSIAECRLEYVKGSLSHRQGLVGHREDETEWLGTVERIWPGGFYTDRGHAVEVYFRDVPVFRFYAPSELEPAPTTDEDDARSGEAE
jgi:hypothetical protein